MRVFFATDIHGSEVCWRKFLNAGKFHKADVLIMGGDMTGKAMVPIVSRNGSLEAPAPGPGPRPHDGGRGQGDGEADRRSWLLPDPADAATRSPRGRADPALVDTRFKAEMVGMVERWMALADERLKGTGIRCVVSPANDDIFELDPIIAARRARRPRRAEHDRARRLHDGLDRLGQPDAVEHISANCRRIN